MAETDNNYLTNEPVESRIDLKSIIGKVLRFWYVFLLFIIAAIAAAWIYLRYQIPVYKAKATVLIRDEKKGSAASELSAFQDLNILKGSNSLDNEIEVFKSRSLMMRVINDLNLQTTYIIKGNIISKEAYKFSPVRFTLLTEDSVKHKTSASFEIKILSKNNFSLATKNSDNHKTYNFNDTIITAAGKSTIAFTSSDIEAWKDKIVYVNIVPLSHTVDKYLSALTVRPINKTSNVLELTMQDVSQQKATDLLNNLLEQHNQDAIEDKNLISENTAEFINERLRYITSELSDVESSAQGFKQKNNLVDVETDAKMYMESDKMAEQKYVLANTQLKLAEHVYQYIIKQRGNTTLLPANLGIADISTTNQINEYNKLVLDRNRLLKSSTEMNPMISKSGCTN